MAMIERIHGLKIALTLMLALVVAACNSTDSTLGVEPSPSPQTDGSTQAPPNNSAIANVYFAPIVGAPVANVTALSRRLSSAAPTNNVKLEPSASTSINHEIRGYFSALAEGETTKIIHVWDVFSPQGQRVHRIQGQEVVQGANGADPWSVVTAATMETIADAVLSQYDTWRRST